MQNEKIKAAITEYLTIFELSTNDRVINAISAELYAAIAPYLVTEPDWSDAPEWAQWRTVDEDGTVTYWEYKPDESGFGVWLQSSEGGRYRLGISRTQIKIRP